MLKTTFIVVKKELKVHFVTPFTLVLIFFSLIITGYFFYTDIIYFSLWNGRYINDFWSLFFNDVRFVLMIVTPVLTMRLFAEEKRHGTIELLLTFPLNRLGIVIAKYIVSVLIFMIILIISMIIYPLLLSFIWEIDPKILISGTIGLFLLGASLISIGLFFSVLSNSQLFAAIGTYGVTLFLWYITWNEAVANEKIIIFLNQISLFDHFMNFSEGVIDAKDIVFYICFILTFVFLTHKYVTFESAK